MKRITRKNVACALCLGLSLGVLSACETQHTKYETPKEPKEYLLTTQVVNDFSDFKDLYQVIVDSEATTLDLNKDKTYASEDGSSMKMTIDSPKSASTAGVAFIRQRLISEYMGYDYTDFSQVKRASAKIYNASEETVYGYFYFAFKGGANTARKMLTLEKGWNTVVYEIDRKVMSQEKVEYMYFGFERQAEEYSLYFDDLALTKTSKPIEEIKMSLAEDEILSFDKNYQKSIISIWTWSAVRMGDIVDFGLTADPAYTKSGRSFYVTTAKGERRWETWYYLRMSEDYSSLIDWKSFKSGDSVEMSIFNKGPVDRMAVIFNTTMGTIFPEYPVMPENDWITYSVSYDYLQQKALEFEYIEEGQNVADIITGIEFAWGEFVNVDEKTFYFDEIKFVRGERPIDPVVDDYDVTSPDIDWDNV